MRTEQERGQLKSLIMSPQWATLEQVAEELCTKVRIEAVSTDSEWESMRSYVKGEGAADGIKRFLQEVKNEAMYEGTGF